ncbi:hypothetical protein [Bacillus paralicheniformis]|uniref:hypothetical protein n=1 Tax=Bacillus paralicheniformis TaxID=1648923 RepID=UPI001E3BB85C|nr:hypothetical protein [Bacillus paralicheniformis]
MDIDPGLEAARNVFQSVIFFMLSALVLWLIAKIGGGNTNFACMVSLSVFATFVPVIRDVIIGLVYYASNSEIAFSFSSLDGYIPAEEPLLSVLEMFDVFYNLGVCAGGGRTAKSSGRFKAGGLDRRFRHIYYDADVVLFIRLMASIFRTFIRLMHYCKTSCGEHEVFLNGV